MKFHISRWHYWYGYAFLIILLAVAAWRLLGGSINWFLFLGIAALVLLIIFEILIRLEQVIITENGIEFRKGILSRHVTRASYQSVSNVFIRQSLFQRMFKFGDVDIDTAGGPEPEIVLHNFQKAGKIEELIESHSHKARQAYAPKK